MNVQVRLAEPFWRVVGQRSLQVELASDSDLSKLLDSLCKDYPTLSADLGDSSALLFVNEEEAAKDAILKDGDRVHILWPIAGG